MLQRSWEKSPGSGSQGREKGLQLLLDGFGPGVLERGRHLLAEVGGEPSAEAVERPAEIAGGHAQLGRDGGPAGGVGAGRHKGFQAME